MHVGNFLGQIKTAQKIIITTHLVPDADGIGSQIALCLALKSMGKEVHCVNEEALLDRYFYLDHGSQVIDQGSFKRLHSQFEPDLLIVVDTNAVVRTGTKMQKYVAKSKNLLFIDHHPCPSALKALHCIDITAAATGQIVGELIETLGVPFTKEIALPLYTAILIDTSSFRYPTVTGRTHYLLGKLLDTGISPPEAYNKIYGTKTLGHMQLLGTILGRTHISPSGKIGWIYFSDQEVFEVRCQIEDTHAFINNLLVLDNIHVACMFRDLGGNKVKISFRSSGPVDVGDIAMAFGGGGHNHASATVLEGSLEEVIEKTIGRIEIILAQAET